MFSQDQYSLLDFGNGRRLERFGELTLDRFCPSAHGISPKDESIWRNADARFVERKNECRKNYKNDITALGFRGVWFPHSDVGRSYFSCKEDDRVLGLGGDSDRISSKPWTITYANRFVLELKGSPFGHVGVFPEQAKNWDRIIELCQEGTQRLSRPLRVLNLFAYTGGSTLAAASAGAEVTHLDAARNVVAQARRNADLSLEAYSQNAFDKIRWIVDDSTKFVKREVKRNSYYDGVILDPPSYGHGSHGEVWRLSRDLEPLLRNILSILKNEYCFVMLSGHTPGFEARVLERLIRDCFSERFGKSNVDISSCPLVLKSEQGETLYSGDAALGILRSE